MSGVIDEDGQQWEHCNGCTRFIEIEKLFYEEPTEGHPYGRDLCPTCWPLSQQNPGCYIEPDPAEVAARAQAAAKIKEEMRGKEWVFTKVPGQDAWQAHIVTVN